jgi:hypothetical protein
MPRPGNCPTTYEKKKTLEEYQAIYPENVVSQLDLYHAFHRWCKNKQKKQEIYKRTNKTKSEGDGSE